MAEAIGGRPPSGLPYDRGDPSNLLQLSQHSIHVLRMQKGHWAAVCSQLLAHNKRKTGEKDQESGLQVWPFLQ